MIHVPSHYSWIASHTRHARSVREIKRTVRAGVFPAKPSTCSCLFSARMVNESQEIPYYVATEKI